MAPTPLSDTAKKDLLHWYGANARDLPWRRTSDPYLVWVSEVMLQQTQVSTVVPFYERWVSKFPTVEALACAEESDVLSVWQGLGYYKRCKNLLEGARHVAERGLPSGSAAEWRHVPGVGAYTAGAIASIAYSSPEAVVDGNVSRVYSRLNADSELGRRLEANAWGWARENMTADAPGVWNQALMELGATVCTSKNPKCIACPLQGFCRAFLDGCVSAYPTKKIRPVTIPIRQATVILRCGDLFGLRQIPNGEWWEGMWEFPRAVEEGAELLISEVGSSATYLGMIKHTVTHHRIQLKVFCAQLSSCSSAYAWFTREGLDDLAIPAPQRKALRLVEGAQASLSLQFVT